MINNYIVYHVLAVEDAADYRHFIRLGLEGHFHLEIVSTASAAIKAVSEKHYDLFLLDIILPDLNGFSLCEKLMTSPRGRGIPVIFLSGKNDLPTKQMAFSLGAEDYIVKPFDPAELCLRVNARIKRARPSATSVLRKGMLQINMGFQKAYLCRSEGPTELPLTAIDFRLLNFLMQNEGVILSREQIVRAVWPNRVHVSERAVDNHIFNLRGHLGSAASYVRAVRGKGYVFSLAETESEKHASIGAPNGALSSPNASVLKNS